MNTGWSGEQVVKRCFALLLLCLLGMNASPVRNASAGSTTQVALSTNMDLDVPVSAWGIFEEGNPVSDSSNEVTPSLDGLSLRCAILGGDPYSNVHCYRNLPLDSTSDLFTLSLSFQYQPASSFNNSGAPSVVQGLEFTVSKWEAGQRYEWALQWQNVGAGAPKWRYWTPVPPVPDPPPPDPGQWLDVGISGGVSGMAWHSLTLDGEILNGQVHYRRFILDQQEFPLDLTVVPAAAVGEPDRLAIAVQLDGNSTETPYELFIDDVTLITTQTFSDVTVKYWAVDWIKRLYSAGITGGCATNPLAYCPEGVVTRAQMAVFLERGMKGSSYSPPAVGNSTGFGDVATTHWAAKWIKQLAADGITAGCGGGRYCPDASVTRAQMAVFLLRAKHGASYRPPVVGGSTGFGDVQPGHWAAAWIKQLVAEGITAGCGNGNYCPESFVTRAQMAVFLVRTFNLP